ncbi:MAG: ATP-binding cassette domain-containing protein [Anaerolineaceae bacterium]|nr:ATP-binding cassette domain-containing protein [Anaerolineaceae bacterium]
MIRVNAVDKSYGKQRILKNVSVCFEAGHIYGLVGPNGSGKTTLMKCIVGFAPPDNGAIYINEKRIGKDVDFAPSTGLILEVPEFLGQWNAMQNLMQLSKISHAADQNRIRQCIRLVGLNPDDPKPVGKYSLGMRQRLGIAQAIMEDPEHLILDEPFNGLDQQGVEEIHLLLQRLKADGKTIILASHSAHDLSRACDTILELQDGKLIISQQNERKNER